MLSLSAFLITLILVSICIFMINYYNETRCASDRTESELDIFSTSITKRLLQAESETLKNAFYMNEVLMTLHTELYKLETSKIKEILSINGGEDSLKDILLLPKRDGLKVPSYHLESIYSDAEVLADKIDEILKNINSDDELDRRIDVGNTGLSNSKHYQIEESHEVLSSKEKEEKCNEWLTFYSVVKGVSWGDLPYDLQKKWVRLLILTLILIIISTLILNIILILILNLGYL